MFSHSIKNRSRIESSLDRIITIKNGGHPRLTRFLFFFLKSPVSEYNNERFTLFYRCWSPTTAQVPLCNNNNRSNFDYIQGNPSKSRSIIREDLHSTQRPWRNICIHAGGLVRNKLNPTWQCCKKTWGRFV